MVFKQSTTREVELNQSLFRSETPSLQGSGTLGQKKTSRQPVVRPPKPEAYGESSKDTAEIRHSDQPDVKIGIEQNSQQESCPKLPVFLNSRLFEPPSPHSAWFKFYPRTVEFAEVRKSVRLAPTKFKCIGYYRDGRRCGTIISEERITQAQPSIKLFLTEPKTDGIEMILSFTLCKEHNTFDIRAHYIRDWSKIFGIDDDKNFGGTGYINKAFEFTSPQPDCPASENPRMLDSAQSITQNLRTVSLFDKSQSDSRKLLKPTIQRSRRVSLGSSGKHAAHLAPQISPNIRKSRSNSHVSSPFCSDIMDPGEIKEIIPDNQDKNRREVAGEAVGFKHLPRSGDARDPVEPSSEEPDDRSDTVSVSEWSPKQQSKESPNQKAKRVAKLGPRQVSDYSLSVGMDRLIRKHIGVGSFIYVFTATCKSTPLVKIGITSDLVRRADQVEKCAQFEGLKEVFASEVLYRKRAEELTHMELSHFRWKGECECKKMHKEWFTVSADAAKQSVERWVEFVKHAYDDNGTLTDHWSASLRRFTENSPGADSEEIQKRNAGDLQRHHELRHERYQNWIKETKKSMAKPEKHNKESSSAS